jgi:hypothetical protein
MTFGLAWVERMEIKSAAVWRILALGKVEALKEPKQHQGCTMDSVEVWVLKRLLEFPPL